MRGFAKTGTGDLCSCASTSVSAALMSVWHQVSQLLQMKFQSFLGALGEKTKDYSTTSWYHVIGSPQSLAPFADLYM